MPIVPPQACCWCSATASGYVSATGGGLSPTGKIPHCDACWERAYETVRRYPERTWKMIEPSPQGALF